MNEGLLDLINGQLAGRSALLDAALEWTARDALFVLAAVAGLFGFNQLWRSRRDGILTGAAVMLASGIAGLGILVVSAVIQEDRPFLHDTDTIQLISHGADNSFPSDHAALAAVIGVVAAIAWPRRSWLFLALAFVVGFSRVFVGVHYPGDVAAGWVIGATAATGAWFTVRFVAARAAPGRNVPPSAA